MGQQGFNVPITMTQSGSL